MWFNEWYRGWQGPHRNHRISRPQPPRRAYFVHMSHGLPHRQTERDLPPGVRLAYDGLILDVPE